MTAIHADNVPTVVRHSKPPSIKGILSRECECSLKISLRFEKFLGLFLHCGHNRPMPRRSSKGDLDLANGRLAIHAAHECVLKEV
jgi:hypothetical protein